MISGSLLRQFNSSQLRVFRSSPDEPKFVRGRDMQVTLQAICGMIS